MLVTCRGERIKCFQDPQLVEVFFTTHNCEDKSKYTISLQRPKKFILCMVCFTFCTFLALVSSQTIIVQKWTSFIPLIITFLLKNASI